MYMKGRGARRGSARWKKKCFFAKERGGQAGGASIAAASATAAVVLSLLLGRLLLAISNSFLPAGHTCVYVHRQGGCVCVRALARVQWQLRGLLLLLLSFRGALFVAFLSLSVV